MPTPSDIEIRHVSSESAPSSSGVVITDHVLFQNARFEAQANGNVGTFSLTIKDTERDLGFFYASQVHTGDEIWLDLDGTRYFGGYIMQVGQTFAFPVVDTTLLGEVTARQFVLRGVNYNALFDRLVARRPSDYLHALPAESGNVQAGTLVTKLATDYLDIPEGFDVSTYVDAVGQAHPYTSDNWGWKNGGEQGISFREEMAWISLYNGAVYYFDANKNLHYHAPEKVFSPWGFSDRPNKRSVLTTHTSFTGATYGFREMDTTQEITGIVNDVFVWGGSPFVASSDPGASGTLFARRQNAVSQGLYGRWQMAEVQFGTLGVQSAVDARAEAIVPPNDSDFPPGVDVDGVIRNRSRPGWQVRLSWFAHDVPTMENGVKKHLVPGDVVTIVLYVHGTAGTPLILTLPLRRVSISFPTLPSTLDGDPQTYVRFEGDFGLALDDPYQLWDAIGNRAEQTQRIINAAGDPTTVGTPGAIWQGEPDEAADGTRTVFTLSSDGTPITYAAASSEVYVNGLRLRQGADYQENPNASTIQLFIPPSTGSTFWVIVRLAG